MKILQKISMVLIIAIIASLTLGTVSTNVSLAEDPPAADTAAKNSKARDAMNDVNAGDVDEATAKNLTGVASKVLTFLQIASGVFAIIMIAVTGFRYIVETAADVRKELKNGMLPIIVGILLVFFATSIAKFIVNVLQPDTK